MLRAHGYGLLSIDVAAGANTGVVGRGTRRLP
jgi:hypothetical protein